MADQSCGEVPKNETVFPILLSFKKKTKIWATLYRIK